MYANWLDLLPQNWYSDSLHYFALVRDLKSYIISGLEEPTLRFFCAEPL